MIELECSAVVLAARKCSLHLHGSPFEIVADHKLLIQILNKHSLDEIEETRFQRLIVLKLRSYQLFAT